MEDYNDIFSDYVAPTNPKSDDNFNIFKILDLEYDEVRLHSRILKYFIENDQGNSFLKVIAESVTENNWLNQCLSSDNVKVSIEKSINSIEEDLSDGRIDILVQIDDFSIIIENKILAKDLENQLIKYFNHLNPSGQTQNENKDQNFLILYLTPNGSHPDEKSIKFKNYTLRHKKDFHIISYKDHILKWLHEYEVNCNKSKGILEQYIRTLKKICRIMTEEEKNRILGLFKEDNKFIQNFHLIKSDIDTIEKQIHDFWREISDQISIDFDGNKLKTHFKEGSIMFNLFQEKRGEMNFYIQYKPNFNEAPFMSIWLNSKKQKEFENKKVNHQNIDFSFQEGYFQKQEEKELFTKDVFIKFTENENIQEHLKLIVDKIENYLHENKHYIKFLGNYLK